MKNIVFISISAMLLFSTAACSDTAVGNDLWDNVTSSKVTSNKQITSFTLNGYKARISGTTVKSVLPLGTSVMALAPVITHNGAAISPESGTVQDFSSPVTYTVTATDGTTEKYTVSVTVLDAAGMANADLSILKVKKGKLQPTFNAGETNYLDAPIPFSDSANPAYNAKQSNSVIADPEILIATMKMELESNGKVSVENATEHVFPEIEVGPNKVTIIVTAADKTTTKKYTVNMYRAIPIFKTGAGEISGYDLNPLEDGATQRGVSWPEKRFSIQSSTITANGEKKEESVVIDNMTGLVWLNQTTQS
ncbi:MAG: cadherin-like beta sandwich domain-containing protein, partial [Spirochaetes bacterium]|nr:cadherin-like beta sandwich domain-containing protein [Spirochaetota bacterium]